MSKKKKPNKSFFHVVNVYSEAQDKYVKTLEKEVKELKDKWLSTDPSTIHGNGYQKAIDVVEKDIIRWALGYIDFRERKRGEGLYWWRQELRKKFDKLKEK